VPVHVIQENIFPPISTAHELVTLLQDTPSQLTMH
jgi:hypothetical protein